nr:MAG TPA: hypothetical protein [Crassvirales sp.]
MKTERPVAPVDTRKRSPRLECLEYKLFMNKVQRNLATSVRLDDE